MKTLALGSIVFLLAFLSACGAGSMDSNPPPPPPPPPVTISANVAVNSTTNGPFNLAMSTSFQPAEWDYQFFTDVPSAVTPLGNVLPSHIRLQTVSQGVPQRTANTWDFSVLDAITLPVLTVGDHSPEMQLGWAPSFMWSGGGTSGTLDANAFTAYAQNMVRYYNTGGFTSLDNVFHVSPSYPNHKITWWGILNEPSINGFSPTTGAADYATVYNQVVPAMKSVDGNIKFAALELCCGTENWVQTFASNVNVQVDVLAAHYYSSCNQRDTDTQLFASVPGFAASVQQIYNNLSLNPSLGNVPVWITENNVNADFSNGSGQSTCNPGQVFVSDHRGSSAFFAAWRPYVFSQVGKAGAQLLHHWEFNADPQFGELNWSGNQAQLQLSYWVDYWLARYFPGGSGEHLLNFTNTNIAQVEVLPILNTDGSVVIMVSNHAVASATDNNGTGLTANISLDISALGPFTSANQLVIDSSTNVANGPNANSIPVTSPIRLTMTGYSVAFLELVP
jgi:hypothetical protein